MTETEAQAHDLVRKKEWTRAIELYDQLLGSTGLAKQIGKERIVACLLGRSECCLELGRHEVVVSDCRRIIKLLADGNENSTGARARRRLVHALFSLRRFSEAEMATREWIALNNSSNNLEALKMLENLRGVLQLANGHKVSGGGEDSRGGSIMTTTTEKSCTYCAMTFRDRGELRAHCSTEQHQTTIMSDEGRDWRWRAPPRGHTRDSYRLCEAYAETGACRYGAQCAEAHGDDELSEWRERFEYRRMRLQRATETELYGKSYTEQLLERWCSAASPDRVMRERLDGVEDECRGAELHTTVSSKCSRREWTFALRTRRALHAVALLQDQHRNHFMLAEIRAGGVESSPSPARSATADEDDDDDQEWLATSGLATAAGSEDDGEVREHRVTVRFRTDIYGTFRQSVVFDLGGEPVLVKHLCVDVLPVDDADRLREMVREMTLSSCERWTDDNAEVIGYGVGGGCTGGSGASSGGEWEASLLAAYPTPRADTFALTQSTVTEKRPTRGNYRARMHELLCVEEMARYEQVARYNLRARLRVSYSYVLAANGTATSTAKYSHSGELFAVMQLGKDVSEDTSAGRLVLNGCATVLVGAVEGVGMHERRRVVYEALVEDKGRSAIYLRLGARCVRELQLKPDGELEADVQFQLNRVPYCEWHYAVDKMHDLRVIFPDTYVEPAIPWTPSRHWPHAGGAETAGIGQTMIATPTDHWLDRLRLNAKQREAVVAITAPCDVPLPPVLVVGPFGTGKTYTLAQAIRHVLRQSDTRVLICTHSNSAADLYIKDYLHSWVEGGCEEARPLRVYYHRRWVATVHPIVQKYCLIDTVEAGGERSSSAGGAPAARRFRPPTLEDLLAHRVVVVTLSISMWLSTVGLPRGHFTHILLDEAAQALECEAVMPLALADRRTRVVLAGDHMQLSPELFSRFAKERNLHVSLLERLYDRYPPAFPCKILLCENYRAHEAITRFTSELFYEQKLVASGRQPRHDTFYPLTFFTTRGEDVQDHSSTAFYNNSEVYELVERVCELRKRWPPAWGKLDDQSIGVVTPYADQVFRIRSELRKRRMAGVSVERVLNVQGKQFRAVFLSTVRTRRTCGAARVASAASDDEDVDYGFLSNSRLLNTAITRAQSLIAVVGDPVALCSIGRCRKVWERFIHICNENGSLYGITWQLLRSQLDGVELKKTYVLNPLAPEFVPRQRHEAYIQHRLQHQHQQAAVVTAAAAYVEVRAAVQPPQVVAQAPPGVLAQRSYVQPPQQPTYVQQQQSTPLFFIPSGGGGPQPPPPPQTVVAPPPPPPTAHYVSPAFALRAPPPPAASWTAAVGFPLASPPPQHVKPPPHVDQRSPPSAVLPTAAAAKPLALENGLTAELHYLLQAPPPQQQQQRAAVISNDNDHIQFFHNVHFPEQGTARGSVAPADLLPPGFTPADMLLAPPGHQLEWCRHLQERHGADAAQRFIDLLVRQQHRQQQQQQQQPPQAVYLRDVMEQQQQQQQHRATALDEVTGVGAWITPAYHQSSSGAATPQRHQFAAVPSHQQQQQQQSVPLYRRQGATQVAICLSQQQPIPPPQHQQLRRPSPPPAAPPHAADWQRQINAEFAAMHLGVNESLEEMLNRTYASVLRRTGGQGQQQHQQHQSAHQLPAMTAPVTAALPDKPGDPFAVLRDLGQRSAAAAAANGPTQLYHYFS